jgi:hypothetical protein
MRRRESFSESPRLSSSQVRGLPAPMRILVAGTDARLPGLGYPIARKESGMSAGFDGLATYRRLREVGLDDRHARAMVDEILAERHDPRADLRHAMCGCGYGRHEIRSVDAGLRREWWLFMGGGRFGA